MLNFSESLKVLFESENKKKIIHEIDNMEKIKDTGRYEESDLIFYIIYGYYKLKDSQNFYNYAQPLIYKDSRILKLWNNFNKKVETKNTQFFFDQILSFSRISAFLTVLIIGSAALKLSSG